MTFIRLIQLCLAVYLTSAVQAEPPGNHPLVWDAMEKKVALPGMTNSAHFIFWVTNNSTSEITIGSVDADCECTVVEARTAFPWTLAPGASGPLNVRVNIRGRFGDYVKTVTVHSGPGPQILTVSMKIPITPAPANISIRQQDVLKAKADRQALFQGSCAVCHATPAMGLTGAALFEKACGICHQSDRRAEFVPDLAALKDLTDSNHWRKWITSGKADTVMPAFAQSAGGILDTNQIESLVKYLTKEFPKRSQSK